MAFSSSNLQNAGQKQQETKCRGCGRGSSEASSRHGDELNGLVRPGLFQSFRGACSQWDGRKEERN